MSAEGANRGAPDPTRREVLRTAAGLAVAGATGACAAASGARGGSRGDGRPNVLWIIADQHRADVAGFAGDPRAHTPALDRLAAGAASVSDVYCQVPLCVPSRQSLVTARHAHRHGTFLNTERSLEQPTVVHALRDAGYATWLVGRAHCDVSGYDSAVTTPMLWRAFKKEHDDAREAGYGHHSEDRAGQRDIEKVRAMNPDYEGPGEGAVFHMEEAVTDEAVRLLRRAPRERPFFLWASFQAPHPPLFPPRVWLDRFADADLPLRGPGMATEEAGLFELHRRRRGNLGYGAIDTAALRNITRAYYAATAWADHCAGRILSALEEEGFADDTIVVYTSDHGELLGEHGLMAKRALYEGALRVPGLVRWPGRVPTGLRLDAVAQHIDLVATVLDLAGVDPGDVDGRSFAPLLLGQDHPWAHEAMSEMLGGEGAAREADGPPEGFCWMLRRGRHKYVQHSVEEVALYDLEADPGEARNLAGRPDSAALEGELRARLVALAPRPWTVTPLGRRGRDD